LSYRPAVEVSEMKEAYLGDGCYASFDGWSIVLRAPREGGDHFIYLEPEVLHALKEYLASLEREFE
jgi:hypothetical protein